MIGPNHLALPVGSAHIAMRQAAGDGIPRRNRHEDNHLGALIFSFAVGDGQFLGWWPYFGRGEGTSIWHWLVKGYLRSGLTIAASGNQISAGECATSIPLLPALCDQLSPARWTPSKRADHPSLASNQSGYVEKSYQHTATMIV